MKVYVDTNVLIDFVCQRKDFAVSANYLMALGCLGKVELQTSALSYVTAMFVAKKYDYPRVSEALVSVSHFVDVQDLKGQTVIEMLTSDWKDYEDATQNHTALLAHADCIVTRNEKDFSNSSLPVYSPEEFLYKLNGLVE